MTLNKIEKFAIGFDIGGTHTKIGLVSNTGRVVSSFSFPTNVETIGVDAYLAYLVGYIRELIVSAPDEVVGIGGSFLGWIDEARTGPFLCFNAPSLHGVNLKRVFTQEFHLPVALTEDSTAHTLAEYHYGSGRGARRFMCLALGTGVSAGVVINGKTLDYTGGCAGDTGHILLRPGGPRCSGGCNGCAEALIGVEGIERLARERFGESFTARQVIEMARDRQEPAAIDLMNEIGRYTGELLASLSHIYLPERIALSGGTASAGEPFLDAVRQRFEEINGDYHRAYARMAGDYYHGVEIVLGKLQGDTGMVGATIRLFNPN